MLQSLMKNYTRKLELMCRMTLEKDCKEKHKEKHSPAAKRHPMVSYFVQFYCVIINYSRIGFIKIVE